MKDTYLLAVGNCGVSIGGGSALEVQLAIARLRAFNDRLEAEIRDRLREQAKEDPA